MKLTHRCSGASLMPSDSGASSIKRAHSARASCCDPDRDIPRIANAGDQQQPDDIARTIAADSNARAAAMPDAIISIEPAAGNAAYQARSSESIDLLKPSRSVSRTASEQKTTPNAPQATNGRPKRGPAERGHQRDDENAADVHHGCRQEHAQCRRALANTRAHAGRDT